jgi:uncharacterized protein
VRLVAAPRPDALARTWMARVPAVFTPASALSPALIAAMPPATDGAIAQLRTFARFGSRVDGSLQRHFPDSALVGGDPAPYLLEQGAASRLAWSVALLSANDDVAGVATVTGGVDQTVWWSPTSTGARRWSALLDRLRAVSDSALEAPTDSGRREARVRLGRAEPLVTSRGLLLVQSVQVTRGDGRVVLARVLVTDGLTVGAGATLADALTMLGERVSGGLIPGAAPAEVDWEGTEGVAARWYDAMRQAMKQGNWSAFGAAFDSLGRALGRPPQ